jgi:hypothetical protein
MLLPRLRPHTYVPDICNTFIGVVQICEVKGTLFHLMHDPEILCYKWYSKILERLLT